MDDVVERNTGRVVVGVDGSAPSRAALDWAVEECRAKAQALTVVCCWQVPALAGSVYEPAISPEIFGDEARATAEAALVEVNETSPDLDVKIEVLEGAASLRLLDLAERACLVVVGSRGRGGVAGLLLGSASQHLVEHAKCPVVVVHAR